MRIENAADRHPHRGHRLHDLRVGAAGQTEAAILSRDRRAEQAERLHLLDDLGGVNIVVLEVMHIRLHVALEEAGDAVQDHRILVGGERRGVGVGGHSQHPPSGVFAYRGLFVRTNYRPSAESQVAR